MKGHLSSAPPGITEDVDIRIPSRQHPGSTNLIVDPPAFSCMSPANTSISISNTINQSGNREKLFLPAVVMKPLCLIVVRAHLSGDHRSDIMDQSRIKAGRETWTLTQGAIRRLHDQSSSPNDLALTCVVTACPRIYVMRLMAYVPRFQRTGSAAHITESS